MNLIEARRFLKSAQPSQPLPFLLAASGELGALTIFVKAEAARRGLAAQPRLLPFGTLGQCIASPAIEDELEVVLLMPWDLIPEADWRSGIPVPVPSPTMLMERAIDTLARLTARPRVRVVYLPAPLPPLQADARQLRRLEAGLLERIAAGNALIAPAAAFSLTSYFGSGNPIAGDNLWEIAGLIVDAALGGVEHSSRKILATDCDGVMWSGIVAEDGLDNLRFEPEGRGFRHFLYQTLLHRMKDDGIILAAVSRNRPQDVFDAMALPGMRLRKADFVAVEATYAAKSSRIEALARSLNLGLDAFVFVDDNPVEIAEVSTRLPQVTCLQFPTCDEEMPAFLDRLARLFTRTEVTDEDRRRTDLYRLRENAPPQNLSGGDLRQFLATLDMRLDIRDAGQGDWNRAHQLINKTNQFNLNGRRFEPDEISTMLATGATLLTARLTDRSGDHGEILSCLISADGAIEALVLSCRVFQRKIEHAFLVWLAQFGLPRTLNFQPTDRNEPLRQFLTDPAFSSTAKGHLSFDGAAFCQTHADSLKLFTLSAPATLKGVA